MAENSEFTTEQQMVVFTLGEENYGIDIFQINEIIRLPEVTSIPRTENHMRGLVNLRGKTIPVIDLNKRFGQFSKEDGDDTRIIVVDSTDGVVGIVVDAVSEVITLEPNQIEPAPALVAGQDCQFVKGVAKTENGLITLIDLNLILAA